MCLKNFVALVLAFVMVFSLTACAQFVNDNEVSSAAVSSKPEKVYISVADYISNGEIYGCQFKLKTPINDIKTVYHYGDEEFWNGESSEEAVSESEHNHDHSYEGDELVISGDTTITMMTGEAKYYYRNWLEDQGVAYIAYFGDPFSYIVGITDIDEVKKSIKAEPIFDEVADGESLFFLPGQPEGIHQLKYQFGDYFVSFFFDSEILCATTAYYAPLWTDYETNE